MTADNITTSEIDAEFPYYAPNEKQEVQIVRPRQVIMGNWILVRNREGAEWHTPFLDLRPNNGHQNKPQ